MGLRRQGINVAVCYIDPGSFVDDDSGTAPGATAQVTADYLAQHGIPVYLVRRGEDINHALSHPLAGRTERGGNDSTAARSPTEPAIV